MNIAAVICNIALFLFTCLVYITDGPPSGVAYRIFNVWLLGTTICSALVIARRRRSAAATVLAIGSNLVLLGLVCWALLDQYPHPNEEGFLAFVVLIVVTPILSGATLLRGGVLARRPSI